MFFQATSRSLKRSQTRLMALAGLLILAGCQPSIGDKCALSTDCSPRGDRLCDTSQPNGYCTVFGCTGDDCPTEATCVLFSSAVSGCASDDRHFPPRTGRSMCLYMCKSNSDCRNNEGYVCADPRSFPYNAKFIADTISNVCLVAASGLEEPASVKPDAAVCQFEGPESDASLPDANTVDAESEPDAGTDASDAALDAFDGE